MKKFFVLLLAVLLCVSSFISCNDDRKGDGEEPIPTPTMIVVDGNQSAYRIVIAKNATEYEINAAYDLQSAIKTVTGVELPVVEDTEAATEAEIVVGKTERASLYTVPQEYMLGYVVFVSEQRIIIEAGSESGMKQALSRFSIDLLGVDMTTDAIYDAEKKTALAINPSYSANDTYYDFMADVTVLQIVHNNTYMQKRLAYMLAESIKKDYAEESNLSISVVDKVPTAKQGLMYFQLSDDAVLMNGAWKISFINNNKALRFSAGDYYGFTGIAKYLSAIKGARGFYNLIPGQPIAGTYGSDLEELEKSTAYAYNKTAEHRIMFYNVLWDNPAPAERNLLNAEMVAQYMPDVLGLQEFNNSKRHKAGDKDLVKLLGELGYVETVDPRVKNVGKWGNGGESVTVGNETFKTFYNCTPLFYNTNTTRCIASEYYWYENQIDAENQGNCGAMDCASKAMTWGVFETIATGERYIVVSTHMCTRSDGIRGLQAREAVAVVNRLIAEYDCPVFFGGDLNGRYIHANHIYFTSEEGGFTDIEQNNLATLYTSKTKSYHRPYPEMNKQYQLIWPTADDDTGLYDSSESVDHILIHNHKKDTVNITVFGTVVDHTTLAGADHFPIFIDFNIS